MTGGSKTEYHYRMYAPATGGLGAAFAVIRRDSGTHLGYVRKVIEPTDRRARWLAYGKDGAELRATASQTGAARLLHERHLVDLGATIR